MKPSSAPISINCWQRSRRLKPRDSSAALGLRGLAEHFEYQKLLDLFGPDATGALRLQHWNSLDRDHDREPFVETRPPTRPRQSNGIAASILVVDDVSANLQVLTGMLKDRGYKVRPVPNGKLALSAARKAPPDLILLDINMPEMNGYEVCQHLKADRTLQGIPVIFISALNENLDKVKAFAIGGVDYITKPFQMEELHARVETHLKLRRLQIELEESNARLAKANGRMSRDLESGGTGSSRRSCPAKCRASRAPTSRGSTSLATSWPAMGSTSSRSARACSGSTSWTSAAMASRRPCCQ